MPSSGPQSLLTQVSSGGVTAADLDELVIDAKCGEASTINNQGLNGQLTYLWEALGSAAAACQIQELVDRATRQIHDCTTP